MANPIKLSELFDAEDGAKEILDIAQGLAQLSKNYKQFARNIDGDSQKVATALGSLTTQTTALRTAMAGVNVSAEQERTGYAALSAQLQQLFQEQQRLLAAQAGIDNTRRTTTEGVRVLTTELGKQQKALKEAYAAGNTEGIKAVALEILKLKANSEDLNRALRGANSIYTAASGSFRALENEARQLGTQLKALEGAVGSDATEVEELRKRLADANAAIIKFGRDTNDGHANVGRYAQSILEAVGSLNQQRTALLASAAALRTQAQATGLSTGEQQHLQTELKQTEAELAKVNGQLRNYGVHVNEGSGFTANLSKGAGELATTFLGAYAGIQGVATVMQDAFAANVRYSDELVDVAKTTGLTADQVEQLATNLKQVDTRTTLDGLLKIAEVGGQLGYVGEDVEKFAKGMDVASQALSDDFGNNVELIATQLGKINTVFGKQLGGDVTENLLHIGSALNQLGAVGAATSPQLADVALRTGAVAANAGLGLDKVLSYAAVLQEVGVSAETSGSALNRLFSTVSTKTKASFEIAKLGDANLTLKEFKRLVNTDFEGAIQAFLKGLKTGGDTTTRMNALLATLKLQSGEAKSAIVTLANNLDTYADRQAVANAELKTGTSLAEEAEKKNNNLAASWEKLKNNISATLTSGKTASFFKGMIDFFANGIFYQEKFQASLAQTVDKTVNTGLASKQLLSDTEALVTTYRNLTQRTSLSNAEQQKLATTILALKDKFGDSVVTINQQTGAYELNTKAVEKAVSAQVELANAQAKTLARQLQTLNAQRDAAKQSEQALAKSADTRSEQLVDIASPDQLAKIQRYLNLVKEGSYLAKAGLPVQVTKEQAELVKKLQEDTEKLTLAGRKLALVDRDRATVLAGLKKLGLDEAAALALVTQTVKAGLPPREDDIEADKKKKQSVADIAKEEYLLQKQRLQARIADLDRQADNPANTEAIRNRAVAKGSEVRRELAALERDEEIREAAQSNKDKIGGDAATAQARVRIQEAYREELLKINRDGDKKLIVLRNALLNQLGELDKIGLESDITAAEKVRDNVNKTYDERQQAAREVSHAQIELARLVRDEEVRNAQGALDKIAAASAKFEQAREKASASVKVYDSAKDIDEQTARYDRLELAVEDSYGKQLLSQKTYDREVRDLENRREADAIAALEAEYGETEEVLRRKLALRRKLNKEELTEEQEKEQRRAEIVQAAVEKIQAVSSAYFDFQSTKLQAAEQNEQASYENSLKVAGNNTALKEQVEKDHAKRLGEIRKKQAENERDQALFSIAINTALAVAKSLGQFGLPLAIPFIAADLVAGGLQVAAVLAKPIPQYFKGRESGPAEFAQLAEQGPELVGKPGSYRLLTTPTVGYLEQGDRVITAPKTRQLLTQHVLVDGHLMPQPALPAGEAISGQAQYHREQADLYYQARSMQQQTQWEARQQRVWEQNSDRLVGKMEQVRRAVDEAAYRRWDELGQAMKSIWRGMNRRDEYTKRHGRLPPDHQAFN